MNTISEQSLLITGANTLLSIHVLFVLFVVGGLTFVYIGYFTQWSWVKNPWFRTFHFIGTAIVVLQAWAGEICPLTTWEMALREKAGTEIYSGSFIQHWLQWLLYYDAPEWIFIVCYTLFGSLTLASWFIVRPNHF